MAKEETRARETAWRAERNAGFRRGSEIVKTEFQTAKLDNERKETAIYPTK